MPDSPRFDRTDRASGVDDIVDKLEALARRPPPRAPRLRGARTLSALLPNGRVVSLKVDPALAPVAETNHLVQFIERLSEQREATLEAQDTALRRLSRTMARDVERLGKQRRRAALRLRRWLVAGDAKLARRISVEGARGRALARRLRGNEQRWVRRLSRRGFWDQIVIATSAPLFAAYGRKGNPFNADNTALTLSLLTWIAGDEASEFLTGAGKNLLPHALRDSDIWSYTAPFGNLLSGWWLMRNRQHTRFVTGFADKFELQSGLPPLSTGKEGAVQEGAVYRLVSRVELSPFIAPDYLLDFETFSGVPAVATATWADGAATFPGELLELDAKVQRGVLFLAVTVFMRRAVPSSADASSLFSSLRVAWVVDTAEPPGTSP